MRGPVTRESAAAVLSDLLTELRDSGADVGAVLIEVLAGLDLMAPAHDALSDALDKIRQANARAEWLARLDACRAEHPWMEPTAERLWPGRWRWEPGERNNRYTMDDGTPFIGGSVVGPGHELIRLQIRANYSHYPLPPGGDELRRERVTEPYIHAGYVTAHGPADQIESRYRQELASEVARLARSRSHPARGLRALAAMMAPA